MGAYLENVVFNGLIARGYSVSVGNINGKEIDFVTSKPCENPYYYSNTCKKQELDFLIMSNELILPIEVKAGMNKKATSIKTYLRDNPEVPFGIRYSLNDLKLGGRILNIPLYLAEQTPRLIIEAFKLIK